MKEVLFTLMTPDCFTFFYFCYPFKLNWTSRSLSHQNPPGSWSSRSTKWSRGAGPWCLSVRWNTTRHSSPPWPGSKTTESCLMMRGQSFWRLRPLTLCLMDRYWYMCSLCSLPTITPNISLFCYKMCKHVALKYNTNLCQVLQTAILCIKSFVFVVLLFPSFPVVVLSHPLHALFPD